MDIASKRPAPPPPLPRSSTASSAVSSSSMVDTASAAAAAAGCYLHHQLQLQQQSVASSSSSGGSGGGGGGCGGGGQTTPYIHCNLDNDSPVHNYIKPQAPLAPVAAAVSSTTSSLANLIMSPPPQFGNGGCSGAGASGVGGNVQMNVRSNKALSSFLNDVFANQHSQHQHHLLSSSPSMNHAIMTPPSLAASTSIGGFTVQSSSSNATHFALGDGLSQLNLNNNNCYINQQLPFQPHAQELVSAAPPPSQWYHGRLDRKTSETRLAETSLLSSYLIRESDRKPGSYVLSFFGRTGINHFRITAICGDYYCGGKQFSSLEELVGYYTVCSDLLKNERLVNPVPPPEPIQAEQRRVVAILPYEKMPDTDELSFRKGDIFVVHNEMSDRWYWCTNVRNQESGLVFADLVEQIEPDGPDGQPAADPNEVYGWFHSRITKEEAFQKLTRAGPGSFLVRPSDNSPGDYSIFFYIENAVQRFRVEHRTDGRYVMGGRLFHTLEDVIQRYKEEQIVEGYRLLKPVIKAPYETRWNSKRAEELLANSADIYATIRECREMVAQNQALSQEIAMKGFLYKKSSKNSKKWKNLYAVLNAKESMLYFYENPKRTRPKSVVHLAYSALYMVHDSLFDRPYCFQLVERTLPCISATYYLSTAEADVTTEWMQAIRPLCSPNLSAVNSLIFRAVHEDPHFGTAAFVPLNGGANGSGDETGGGGGGSPKRNGVTNGSTTAAAATTTTTTTTTPPGKGVSRLRSVYLTMIEAHRLPVKIAPHPFVVVSLNKVCVAKTSVKCPPDPIWEEDFVLEDIPADVTYLKLTLMNKGKRSKDTELAEINIEFTRLQSGDELEEWLHFTGLSLPLRDDWGSVRIRVRFLNELIMPLKEYSPLKDLLLGVDDLEVIALCEEFCYHDRLPLANALLKISRYERYECRLIRALVEREIQIECDQSTLFRSNSLTTTLVDQYMKATCQNFLLKSLTEPITRVLESKTSCELNPAKLDSPTEACSNAENLLNILDEIVEIIFQNAAHCPPTVRYICATIKMAVSQKWPNDTLVRTRAVSAFIFLRLLCPAILNPRQFNLISEMPSETALRTFILVAKSLQNLANLIEFGTKSLFITPDRFEPPPPPNSKREPWMEIVNPFILKNKSRMIKYIDEIATVPNGYLDQSLTLEPDLVIKGPPDRELANILSICESHITEIQQHSHNRPTLKKLYTVIEMLSSHKSKYLDLVQ